MKRLVMSAALLCSAGVAAAECGVAGNGANRCVSVTIEEVAVSGANLQVKTSGDETLLDCVPVQSNKLRMLSTDDGFEEMFAMLVTAYVQGTVTTVYTSSDPSTTCMITTVLFE